ncbi:hypothetical protein LCGC14_2154560 [marine sediment metagenome]|uniref:Uncharacterized protein n=1 Tax=marine sediment metagenome TaxID=412755 RepID=A0A0F9DUG4_9ZZZZ
MKCLHDDCAKDLIDSKTGYCGKHWQRHIPHKATRQIDRHAVDQYIANLEARTKKLKEGEPDSQGYAAVNYQQAYIRQFK